MTKTVKVLWIAISAATFCATPLSPHWSPTKVFPVAIDSAEARVGRPLTPGSVAGVNRRVNRRAYYGAAAVGAAAVGAGAYGTYYNSAPACGYHPYPPCY
jgi:hypothetical protein